LLTSQFAYQCQRAGVHRPIEPGNHIACAFACTAACVFVCVCVRACGYACACACGHACACAGPSVLMRERMLVYLHVNCCMVWHVCSWLEVT